MADLLKQTFSSSDESRLLCFLITADLSWGQKPAESRLLPGGPKVKAIFRFF